MLSTRSGCPPWLVYAIERVACRLNRQRRDLEGLAVGRNSRNAGSDPKPNIAELTQLLHHTVDLLSIRPLRIQDRLRVVEDYQDLLGGQEWA